MNWHVNQLKYAFGLGGLMSFYGVVSMVIYLLPPNMVSNQYKIVVIALVLLTLPFTLMFMLIGSIRSRRKAKRETEAAAANEQPDGVATPAAKPAAAASAEYPGIAASAEEAVQFLKASNLGAGGKDAVYSLPWYVIAGAPRSGKTSLVVGSNLNFQTLPSQRQSEQKFVRPTGNVDWRVTSDAVFVDTAGRYQTEGIDGEEWTSLLDTLKKYRGDRPIDGFILTVNTESILKADERKVEETAKVLRKRLDEAMAKIDLPFPVYLVFTNADAMEGFRDSFSNSKNEGKTLVWGSTFPIEKSENSQTLFDGEFEILHNSLMKRRIVRLSAPFSPVRQLRIFNFPLHFGSARRRFGAFVNTLFRPDPFSRNPFLRGFYFTASPPARSTGNAPASVAAAYFSERFIRDVVLRDRDLVKTYLATRQRAPILGWLLTGLGTLLVLGLLAMSAVSLFNNRRLLEDAQARGVDLVQMVKADAGRDPLAKKEQAVRDELTTTDNLRQLLVRLDDNDRNSPPLSMRFGLYSGETIYKKHLLPMYLSVVEQRFKEPALKKLVADLTAFSAGTPVANPSKLTDDEEKLLEKNLDRLKAYLMLSGAYKEQAQANVVADVLRDYWSTESKVPADMKQVADQQLDFWAKQIDRTDVNFPTFPVDQKLVAAVRTKLKDYPPEYRYLSRKVTEISKQVDESVGPTTVDSILTRNGADTSFTTGTYQVPGAFTRPGLDLMKEAIKNADQEMQKDDWVMGDAGKADVPSPSKIARIEDRYYRDYTIHWDQFIQDASVRPYKDRNDAANAFQAFSLPNSPLKIILREAARNTNLAEDPNEGWWAWIKKYLFTRNSSNAPLTEPEKAYKPLFEFIGPPDARDKTPADGYALEMNQVFVSLNKNATSDDGLKRAGEEMANDKDPLGIKNREGQISNKISMFNATPAGQGIATLLMEPIARLRSLMSVGGKEVLAKTWSDQILPGSKEIEKGFPFEDGTAEADLKNLSLFLAPGDGKLSRFYDDKLKSYFEEANGQLRVRQGSDLQFSDDFVAYLNNAFALRKALFGTSSTPKFEYEFTLRPVKDALFEITIDGQKTTSEGTGSLRGTFPASGSAETGVIMRLASTGGVATSSAPPPVAPPPSNSANSANSTTPSVKPSGTATSGTGAPGELVFQGQWGLFRFVERGSPEKQPDGSYLLKYTVGGKPVTATIKAGGGDLFNRDMFRQLRAPQNMLKQ